MSFQELIAKTPIECAEMNPAYWFADPNDDEELGRSEQAIAVGVCNRCPIKFECLQEAMTNDIQHGIWGGLVPQQREAYKKRVAIGGFRFAS